MVLTVLIIRGLLNAYFICKEAQADAILFRFNYLIILQFIYVAFLEYFMHK